MSKKMGNIEIYMGPKQLGGPDDLLDTIVKFIKGTKKYLFIAVQELDCPDIAKAIIERKQKGVQVKLVLEGDYLKSTTVRENPFIPGGKHEINRELHDAILRSKIKVNTDFNPNIFHQKFIIRDRESVMTGSTNFTDTGISKNLNHLVIIHDEKIAKIYNREFTEISQGHFGKLNEGHDPKPEDKYVSGVRLKVLFAPDHNPEMEIMKQIAKAKESVDFAIFTFSESSGIDDQLGLIKRNGVNVRGAMCKTAANQEWSAKIPLREADVKLWMVPDTKKPAPRPRKLHHKLMVIDKKLIIAGSFNYTGPANKTNDENIIIIGNLLEDNEEAITKQQELAQYAYDEIDRIINEFGKIIR